MVCLELVMFALLMRAGPAWAGQYVVSYSGGGASRTGSSGTFSSLYSLDSYGKWGSQSTATWGTETRSDGTVVATSGALHLGGTITATFTWQAYGYGYGTAEDPPKAVVIKETCNADWYGASDTAAVPSGSSSNGLGFSYEQTGPYPYPYDPRRVYVEGRSVVNLLNKL